MYFLFLMNFLITFFSLVYVIIKIQYRIQITYKIHVNQLFVPLAGLLVDSRLLLVVKFWGTQRFYVDVQLCRLVVLNPTLSKGQLYMYVTECVCYLGSVNFCFLICIGRIMPTLQNCCDITQNHVMSGT